MKETSNYIQAELTREALCIWFEQIATEQPVYILHQTYAKYANVKRVAKTCKRLENISSLPDGTACFIFTELGTFGGRVHCHGLISPPVELQQHQLLNVTAALNVDGIAKFELANSNKAVSKYITKYLTKELFEDMWHVFVKGGFSPVLSWK
jgi:hypothetical protein